jgi:hypothetical protein
MPIIRATYIAYRCFKELLHRLTGMDREARVAETLFTAGLVAGAAGPVVAPVTRALRRRPSLPSPASRGMGFAVLRHAAHGIGGEPLRETPYAGAIIALAMARPAFQIIELPFRVVRVAFAQIHTAWRYLTVGGQRQRAPRGAGNTAA